MGAENNQPSSCFTAPTSVDRASQARTAPLRAGDVCGDSFFQSHQSVLSAELAEADAYASVASAVDRVRRLAILLARQAAAEDDAAERRKGVK
jgi:hypothetical protein